MTGVVHETAGRPDATGSQPRIQDGPLDLQGLISISARADCGALACFEGVVRDHHDGRRVLRLTYTAHERIADRLIREIEAEVAERHGVPFCRVVHRVGPLEIGEGAIIAVVRSPHRAEAFAALEEVVDRVKHEVPIWKEEHYEDGTSAFVEGCSIAPDPTPAAKGEL
ncbi:MAG: molybdenum cofactor biosynthesis protein MoaE [Acidimicrobiales bacterium]|nr:molybdenum cofactor biosynthesis protein MoaE [Acidimicrobiales bacterium]